jgi:hypothetical protein
MRAATLAAIFALAGACSGCAGAAGPIGTAAGDVVGGTAWLGEKGAKLAFRGGKFAAKTTGRTVKGAANGIHEEFSKPDDSKAAAARSAQAGQPS